MNISQEPSFQISVESPNTFSVHGSVILCSVLCTSGFMDPVAKWSYSSSIVAMWLRANTPAMWYW